MSLTPGVFWSSLSLLLAGLTVIFLFFTPEEKVIGSSLKLVYLHGGLARWGLVAYILAGFLGLLYIFWRREIFFYVSFAGEITGFSFWLLSLLISFIAAYRTWGGIYLAEPRNTLMLLVLGASLINLLFLGPENRMAMSTANVAIATGLLFFLFQGQRILHPFDPIGASDSPAIEVPYFIVSVLLFMLTFLTIAYLTKIKMLHDYRK